MTRARTLAITLLQTSDSGTHGALIEAAFAEVRRETVEVCAAVVENGQETFSNYGSEARCLSPRLDGNTAGLPYAVAIRALSDAPAAESGDETKDWAWAYRQLDARYEALRSECEGADNDAPHPTRALAKLFAALMGGALNWIATATECGLTKPIEYGVWTLEPTDLGKQALRLAGDGR